MKFWARITAAVLLILGISTAAAADEISFGWNANNPPLEGYRLYESGVEGPILTLNAEDTTATIPEPTDGKPHNYWLTAFNGEDESGPSDIATWMPDGMVRVEGFLIIKK